MSKVRPGTRDEVDWMIKAHYLGRWPGVVVANHVMTVAGFPAGACIWALPPRETNRRYGVNCWELARLWIDDDVPRNAETWFISKCVKWIVNNRPDVHCLVSYADPSVGHQGTIYKAANWQADGRTDEGRKSPRCDYVDVSGKRYSRRAHIPEGVEFSRVPRTSKWRFIYRLPVRKSKPEYDL